MYNIYIYMYISSWLLQIKRLTHKAKEVVTKSAHAGKTNYVDSTAD